MENNADNNKAEIPSTLNVLTILTFIGCAFELFSNIKNYFSGEESLKKIQDAQSKMDQMPEFAKKFVGPDVLEMTQKGIENKVPLLILALVSIALCVFGAIEMRKLKKQGYTLWLVGEILPIVVSPIFLGMVVFKTVFAIFMIFPLIFIILYTTQRKYLIN